MEQLTSYLSELKDGEDDFKNFISQCWLVMPTDFSKLYQNYQEYLLRFAQKLSEVISEDNHMLPITSEEIIDAFLERQSNFIN